MKTIKFKIKKYRNRTLDKKTTHKKIRMKHRISRHIGRHINRLKQFGGAAANSIELKVQDCIDTTVIELNALESLLQGNINREQVDTNIQLSLSGTYSFGHASGIYQNLSSIVNLIITKANRNFKNNNDESAQDLYQQMIRILPYIKKEVANDMKHKLALIFIRGISAYIRSLIVNKNKETYPEDARQNIPFIEQFLNKPKDDSTFQEDNINSAIDRYAYTPASTASVELKPVTASAELKPVTVSVAPAVTTSVAPAVTTSLTTALAPGVTPLTPAVLSNLPSSIPSKKEKTNAPITSIVEASAKFGPRVSNLPVASDPPILSDPTRRSNSLDRSPLPDGSPLPSPEDVQMKKNLQDPVIQMIKELPPEHQERLTKAIIELGKKL